MVKGTSSLRLVPPVVVTPYVPSTASCAAANSTIVSGVSHARVVVASVVLQLAVTLLFI
jgi:hypothetical protein